MCIRDRVLPLFYKILFGFLFYIYFPTFSKSFETFLGNSSLLKSPDGIKIHRNKSLKTILFADDQAIFATSEDDLQRAIYILHKIGKEYNCNISESKTKVMAFIGDEPVRTKICIDNTCIEQISHFNYRGRHVTYDQDRDIEKDVYKRQT